MVNLSSYEAYQGGFVVMVQDLDVTPRTQGSGQEPQVASLNDSVLDDPLWSFHGLLLELFRFLTAAKDIAGIVWLKAVQCYIVLLESLPEGDCSPSVHHANIINEIVDPIFAEKSLQRSFGRSFNGFAAYVTEAEVQKLKRLPGVESVFHCRKLYPQTTRSMDYIQLSDGIARNPGVASDITIGVIDSGIWPESPSFKDDGLVPFLRNGRENVKVALTSFATRARYYSIDDLSSISARDRTGHGTHVASIVAGNYVKGASYYGIADGLPKEGFLR
ncbi:subtilisin-like protease SBT4.3 [Tanacetum coccineum]